MATYVMWQAKGQHMGETQPSAHHERKCLRLKTKKDDWINKQLNAHTRLCIRPQTFVMQIWKQVRKNVEFFFVKLVNIIIIRVNAHV